ncbi:MULTISPECIES: DUF4998 domain-containing protein [Flavobacteriaceae]|uniref:F5/8 type C domain-containing protein n=2 Tax=Flavobacteriaceae TaxID=49546 RepID=A0A4Y8AQD3_9FLAO|nr:MULTISPECIES: DUF4998 domain-containing protein [Flavobacteriaceae]TEW72993.1 hypothetical protein E2488_12435 [Gramella jeungdoensis]
MKKIKYIIPIIIAVFLMTISCTDTFEVHDKYLEGGEIIYTSKVDSLETHGGNNRLKITGYLTNGFSVNEITVYWNKGEDSQTFPYTKTANQDTDFVELVVEGLEEQSYQFDVFSKDTDGNKSIKITTFGTVYGELFRSNLEARAINSFNLNAEGDATLNFKISSDLTRNTEVEFTNLSGNTTVKTLALNESDVILEQLDVTKPIKYRTFYVPTPVDEDGNETAIDEFDSDWKSYIVPTVFDPIFASFTFEPIVAGVTANWENTESTEIIFTFQKMVNDSPVISTVTSSAAIDTFTIDGMKGSTQDIEITLTDIYGNSISKIFAVTPMAPLGKGNWSIIDFSTEEAGGEGPVNGYASAAIDGDLGTFWHSNWSSTGSSYPHYFTIDMGAEKSIAGFEIFSRSGYTGGATVHEFWVSSDNVNFTKVATLNAALDPTAGSLVNADTNTKGRYVKYLAVEGPNNFTYLGEINVIERLDNSDWSIVDFSSEEAGGEGPVNGYASAAIDGDLGTFWHTTWSTASPVYPHYFTVDLGEEKSIGAFEVFRRSGNGGGATIHEFWVSNDNVNFIKVATLNSQLTSNDGFMAHPTSVTTARYVKYVAVEGSNTFTHLSEINIYGALD